MKGRLEHKIRTEEKIREKIENAPRYLKEFYYSLQYCSHTTKLRYVENILRLFEYLCPGRIPTLDEVKEISVYEISEYMNTISTYKKKEDDYREMESTSMACIFSSLSALFSFLEIHGYIMQNPIRLIKRPKTQEHDVVYLEPEEVKEVERTIFSGVGSDLAAKKQKDWQLRDYLLFRIPIVNGIRVSALCEINIDDIHLNKNTITVTEKGNITKDVYIDDKTADFISKWLIQRDQLLNEKNAKSDALFISNRRTRMTVRSIELIIKKYADGINGKHITPHKLRSTFGTNTYRQKRDIYLVANALGHKNTAPTRRYAKVFDEDKKNAVIDVAALYD